MLTTFPTIRRREGFTIVELLIVIVVIGILAAITIVAYNGIQERAETTKITSQASAYVRGLKLWEADVGSRVVANSCIAPIGSLSAGNICPVSERWTVNTPYDTAFMQKLASYSGVSQPQLGRYSSTSNPAGQMWYIENYYSDSRSVLFYEVGPNSDCGLSNVLSPNPGFDNMTLLNAKYTAKTSTSTQCIIEVFKY